MYRTVGERIRISMQLCDEIINDHFLEDVSISLEVRHVISLSCKMIFYRIASPAPAVADGMLLFGGFLSENPHMARRIFL